MWNISKKLSTFVRGCILIKFICEANLCLASSPLHIDWILPMQIELKNEKFNVPHGGSSASDMVWPWNTFLTPNNWSAPRVYLFFAPGT